MDDVTTFYWYVLEGHSFKKKYIHRRFQCNLLSHIIIKVHVLCDNKCNHGNT